MAMTGKKAPKKEPFNLGQHLLEEIDVETLLVGVLGGIAAGGGITPPLTRILMMMGGSNNSQNIAKDFTDIFALGPFFVGPLWIQQMLTSNVSTTTAVEAQKYAIVSSGALEAMLMMTLMKNPATISALGGVANATITAVGGLVGKIPAAAAV